MKTVLLFEKHLHKLLSVILGGKVGSEVPHVLDCNSSLAFPTAVLPKK